MGSGITAETSETGSPSQGFRRVVLKLSGESFMAAGERGIEMPEVVHIAKQIQRAHQTGCQIAIVIGGGNILRGAQFKYANASIHEETSHYMGMLATVMNALAMQSALEGLGIHTRVISAITMNEVAEPYIRRRAVRHLEKKRVCIFAAGTGNPYFTTDTTAALRALQIRAGVLAKGTKVDGVYDADPVTNKNAKKFKRIEVKNLRNLLVHEDSVAGGYDLMDIVALKEIERSKILSLIHI